MTLIFGTMKNTVGVNGIDPVRQGIHPIRMIFPIRSGFSNSIGFSGGERKSLANRANAIRPYVYLGDCQRPYVNNPSHALT